MWLTTAIDALVLKLHIRHKRFNDEIAKITHAVCASLAFLRGSK